MTLGEHFPPGDYRIPERPITATDLIAELWGETPPAGAGSHPRYIFRGQLARHERWWPPEDRKGIGRNTYHLDSLVTSEYRGLEDAIDGDPGVKASHEFQLLYGTAATWVRHVIAYAATWLRAHEADGGLAKLDAWLGEQVAGRPAGQRLDKLGSIGQHYGLRSGYLDATADPSVAVWFATHRWDGSYAGPGESVIYRFDTSVMAASERAYADATGRRGTDAMRHVDIRDTPAELAPRAAGQAGLSLIYYDNPFALCPLARLNGAVAFRFTRPATAPPPGAAGADRIKPPGDRMPHWFDQLHARTGYRDEVQKLVDRLVNVDLPRDKHIEVDEQLWKAAWTGYQPTAP